MIINRFSARNFRNIEECDIEFSPGVNLLYGKNAQGKTNVIEGIYLFSRGKSFRCESDRDLIKNEKEGFNLSIDYNDKSGKNTLEYSLFGRERKRKKAFVSATIQPSVLEVIKTYIYGNEMDLVVIPEKDGVTDIDFLKENIDKALQIIVVSVYNVVLQMLTLSTEYKFYSNIFFHSLEYLTD